MSIKNLLVSKISYLFVSHLQTGLVSVVLRVASGFVDAVAIAHVREPDQHLRPEVVRIDEILFQVDAGGRRWRRRFLSIVGCRISGVGRPVWVVGVVRQLDGVHRVAVFVLARRTRQRVVVIYYSVASYNKTKKL